MPIYTNAETPLNSRMKARPGDRFRWSTRVACVMTLWLFSLPASALDFSQLVHVYTEDYEGETSYPLTPELDLLSLGPAGAEYFPEPLTPVLLSGTSLALAVVTTEERIGIAGPVSINNPEPNTKDLGLRFVFDNVSHASVGQTFYTVQALFQSLPPDLGGSRVLASLEILGMVGSPSAAQLDLFEYDEFSVMPANSTFLALTMTDAVAILSGSEFTIDLFIDRTARMATTSVTIEGLGEVAIASIPLTEIRNLVNFSMGMSGGWLLPTPPTSSSFELAGFELYTGTSPLPPPTYQFNLDIGSNFVTTSTTLGAAGLAGPWNVIPATGGPIPLDDVAGTPTSVTATVDFDVEGIAQGGGNPLPDYFFLIKDSAEDCVSIADWSVSLDNLPNGPYRVYLYAQQDEFDVETGDMVVNGVAVPSLSGLVSSFVQGTAYDIVDVSVTTGTLLITGAIAPGGPNFCAAIGGIQVEPLLVPAFVPSLGWGAMIALMSALSLVGIGVSRMKREVDASPK